MKKKTYKIIDDESVLVSEEILDEKGNILYAIDYSTKPVFEKKGTYNEEGLLVEMVGIEEGVEKTKSSYSSADGGNYKESLLFIGGELYEKETMKYSPIGFVNTVYRDGDEALRIIMEDNGSRMITKMYNYGEFVEKQITERLEKDNLIKVHFFNSKDQLIGIRVDTFNNDDMLLKREEFGTTDNLLKESIFEVDGTSIISEIHRDLVEPGDGYQVKWEYDGRGNCIRNETKDLTGNLLSFFIKSFDLQNRIIEEVSLNRGSGDAISGGFQSSLKNHFKYEYEP